MSMDRQGTSTDHHSDSQFSSMKSQQSSSASQQASSTSPQSGSARKQASSTSPQSSSASQQAILTSPQSSSTRQASSTSPQSGSTSQQASLINPQSGSTSQQASSTSQQSSSTSPQSDSTSQQASLINPQSGSTSQQSSSTSPQSGSTSRATSTNPQSSMTRQQASSTIAQSSMTSSNLISRGQGSDLGESIGAQARSEYTENFKSEGREGNQPGYSGYSHQPVKRRGQGTEGTLHLTFANPDAERESLRYYQDHLQTFLRQHDIDVINIEQGSIVVNINVSGDFTKETILDVLNFLRQGPQTTPKDIQTTMQLVPDVCFNLNINAENVQVGDNNTMNVDRQGTSTDQHSDSQFSSMKSQQSSSARQQASSTSPQSSSASQQAISTSPQSSSTSRAWSTSPQSSSTSQQASLISPQSGSTSQQASSTSQQSRSACRQSNMTRQQASSTIIQSSMTSPKFITRGLGSDLGGSSGAQVSSEYTENCSEVAAIRIKCDTERTHHQIKKVLDDLKNLMKSPQVAMEIEENTSKRNLSLNIRRRNVPNTLSMYMIINRIVNFRFLHEYFVSGTATGEATYNIGIPQTAP